MGIAYTDTVMGIVLHTLSALGYAGLAVRPWRALANHQAGTALPIEKAGLAVVLLLHALALYDAMLGNGPLQLGLGVAFSATLWLGMVVFLFESLMIRVDSVRLLLLPLAALAALSAVLMPPPIAIPHADNHWLPIHLILSLAAYGFMTIAALHATIMAAADRRLHRPTPATGNVGMSRGWSHVLDAMPPLLVMERLLFRQILIGFVFLTLAIVTGARMSQSLSGPLLPFDHKTVFTVLSWITFGILLAGRMLRGWRGRIALRYTLTGLILLLLAYAGSRFVIEFLLHQ